MKYIKLFEDFNTKSMVAEDFNSPTEIVFDWFPYSSKEGDPAQSQVPQTLTLNELNEYVKTASPDVSSLGLFISHTKQGTGFNRIIATSFSPLMFELSTFDENYQKKSEFKNVDISKVDMGNLSKGVSALGRFGLLDDPA